MLFRSKIQSSNADPHGTKSPPRDASASEKLRVDVRELSREESLALLARHHVGHVGITFHDRLRLKLCNYVYSEGWIYARTELGADATIARHHPWAAFEVDEVSGLYDWRSVEVSGSIEFLSSDIKFGDWFAFENAVRLMRAQVPQVLTADDPTPQRVQLVRVHLDSVFGRESQSLTSTPLPLP